MLNLTSGWDGTIVALVPVSPIIFTRKCVGHGVVWCGVDQAKKQAPHFKTGSPMRVVGKIAALTSQILSNIDFDLLMLIIYTYM